MQVLLVAGPLVGHLSPLLPLADALRTAGHGVLLATGGDALGVDTGGIPMHPVSGPPRWPTALRVAAGHPRLAVRDATGQAGTRFAGALFAAINADGMLDATVELARRWRPDLVVHEPFAAAGAVAAAAVGVPAVLHDCSLWDPRELVAAVTSGRPFRRAAHRHGVTRVSSAAVLVTAPPSLVGHRPGQPMRAVPSSGAGELPDWLARPGDRPRVLVNRTTAHGTPGTDPIRPVLAAARHLDVEFVLVRGPQTGPLPDNVRVTGWIPIDRALPHADAFVHHGGAGGMLQALAAGVPQLAVPGVADRRHNAELVARRGAGLAVDTADLTPAVLERLLTDPGLRSAAAEVRNEIAGLPAPAAVVPVLEALAAGR